jgi:hypothetical protein
MYETHPNATPSTITTPADGAPTDTPTPTPIPPAGGDRRGLGGHHRTAVDVAVVVSNDGAELPPVLASLTLDLTIPPELAPLFSFLAGLVRV